MTAQSEATSAAKAGQARDVVFRDPVDIPGSKKKIKIYRHADSLITAGHKQRYVRIIDLFQTKLLTVRDLVGKASKTQYTMKMCGRSPEEARPSILICHPSLDVKVGRLIWNSLTERHLRQQYEYHLDDNHPAFGIHLFFQTMFRHLGRPMGPLSLHMSLRHHLSGAQLFSSNMDPICTITCGVSFSSGSPDFALTSAHAFEDDIGEEIDKPSWDQGNSTSGQAVLTTTVATIATRTWIPNNISHPHSGPPPFQPRLTAPSNIAHRHFNAQFLHQF